ncbi:MAG TPA: AlkA N-terminal domain-containing protein [Acidimicrobiia bacterium]|nr:AlkA N-terminal domain-containing protein [Acidimicrobiia bacterium]
MATSSFTAVVTTGIYCRDGCPATPLRRNTLPYEYAAAAEAAGFRPCLRCRPDRVPDPGWVDAPELVCRALRLITDGYLDGATEDVLAARLGVSARHLRRLFDEHVGATPAEVARSRRAHFARRILDDTELSIAEVSRAAGFTTVRHMNRVMKQVFQFTPQELRAKRRDPRRLVADGGLELRLPYRAPLAWDTMIRYLAPRAIPGVEAVDVDAGVYRRTIVFGDAPGVIEVRDSDERTHVLLRVHLSRFDGLVHLVQQVRRQFDLDADPEAIDAFLARDPKLRPLVRRHRGLRVPGAYDPVELGARAILGQQVTVAGATRLAGRVVEAHGTPVPGLEALGLTHTFPSAAVLGDAPLERLGLTAARARAVREFAAASPKLRFDGGMPLAELVGVLVDLPGIGAWTAHYIAMRAAGERDAFPAGDLGLRKALDAPSAHAVGEASNRWRPWRAYAAMQLWCSTSA